MISLIQYQIKHRIEKVDSYQNVQSVLSGSLSVGSSWISTLPLAGSCSLGCSNLWGQGEGERGLHQDWRGQNT